MSIAEQTERRGWANPGVLGSNAGRHFHEFIIPTFVQGLSVDGYRGDYGWYGRAEDWRLLLQNGAEPHSWGDGDWKALLKLRERGISPRAVLEVSAGGDASLIKNVHHVFPEAYVVTAELSKVKVEAARRTLESENYPMNQFRFIPGDATQTLYGLAGQMDLVHIQNTLMHFIDGGPNGEFIPAAYPPESRENFGTIARMVKAMTAAMKPGAYALVSDIDFSDWDNFPAPGYEDDLEAKALTERARGYIQRATFLGWDARHAHAWRSPEAIRGAVVNHSERQLAWDPSYHHQTEFKGIGAEHPFTAVTGYITLALVTGTQVALKGHEEALSWAQGAQREAVEAAIPRLRGAEQYLLQEGRAYVDCLMSPKILTSLPTIHWQLFRKV